MPCKSSCDARADDLPGGIERREPLAPAPRARRVRALREEVASHLREDARGPLASGDDFALGVMVGTLAYMSPERMGAPNALPSPSNLPRLLA